MIVFGHEDVAAAQLRQEALDGVMNGLKFFPSNVLMLCLGDSKSSSFEALV
jgi:hypothetical protein